MEINEKTLFEGKSQQEICQILDDIKVKIVEIKEKANESFRFDLSEPLEEIAQQKKLFEQGLVALDKIGGKYPFNDAELRAIKFQKDLSQIASMCFIIGGPFGGNNIYDCKFDGDKVFIEKHHNMRDIHAEYTFPAAPFLAKLESLEIGEWKNTYINPMILDGTHWSLRILYTDDTIEPFIIKGRNAYPFNFREFQTLFIGL